MVSNPRQNRCIFLGVKMHYTSTGYSFEAGLGCVSLYAPYTGKAASIWEGKCLQLALQVIGAVTAHTGRLTPLLRCFLNGAIYEATPQCAA